MKKTKKILRTSNSPLYMDMCDDARKEINMEDKKSMEVATDQNEGYEFDEGIEPTPEEIEAAKKLAEQEV